MTASTVSASMVMRLTSPSRVRADVGTGLGGVTGWHICDGSRQQADRLLIRPARWARPGPANPGTGQMKGTHTAARSVASHPEPPAPILTAAHPEPPGTTLTDPQAPAWPGRIVQTR